MADVLTKMQMWPIFLLAGIIALTTSACSDYKAASLSTDVLGIWRTDSPQYHNRYIELSETLMILGTGQHDPNIYHIKKIQEKPRKNIRIYILTCYTSDNSEFTFEFNITSEADGLSLKLKNQGQVVWRKSLD